MGLKTVVNKTSIIDSTYRNFEMEVIAGEEEFVTKVVEYGFTFHFDFSKVLSINMYNSLIQGLRIKLFYRCFGILSFTQNTMKSAVIFQNYLMYLTSLPESARLQYR